jgi:hypothetical protein
MTSIGKGLACYTFFVGIGKLLLMVSPIKEQAMKHNSSPNAISWIAAIAFILVYLFLVNPWVSNLGNDPINIDMVRTSGAIIGSIGDGDGVAIHTAAGVLVIGGDSAVTASGLDGVNLLYRLGSIVFMPAASQDF